MIRSSSSATSAVMKDIRYYYDAAGKPVAIRAFTRTSSTANFTDTIYYLQTNLQGDVVGIYNASGTKIYEYAYDAWGNIIKSSQVATGGSDAHAVNPFRYRGYYYDTETGLYYVSSRYYNPEFGRWINADIPETLTADFNNFSQYNLFAYCFNNPVNMSDVTGAWPSWATKLVIGTVCAAVAVTITVATAGTGVAAVVPALVAVGKTVAISTAVGAGFGAAGHRIETGSWEGAGSAALAGAADGYMWGGIGAAGSSVTNALQASGKIPKRVKISNLVNNPTDPYVTMEPKQGAVFNKIQQIQNIGTYEYPVVKSIGQGFYEIQNGHHTVHALKSLGKKIVKVWLTK